MSLTKVREKAVEWVTQAWLILTSCSWAMHFAFVISIVNAYATEPVVFVYDK